MNKEPEQELTEEQQRDLDKAARLLPGMLPLPPDDQKDEEMAE